MTFDSFTKEVNGLLNGTAGVKGYSQAGPDGQNKLYEFILEYVGQSVHGHALGEIIYKAVRYASRGNIEDVKKIASWAFLIVKHHEEAHASKSSIVTGSREVAGHVAEAILTTNGFEAERPAVEPVGTSGVGV